MSYVEKNLMPGEKIEGRARIHWFVYAPGAIFLLLSALSPQTAGGTLLLFLSVLLLANAYMKMISTELAVTSKRLIAKKGFISRRTVELNLSRIESLSVDQSLIGRLLNYGKVTVHGTGGVHTPFKFIADPLALRRQVNEAFEKTRDAGRPE